MSEQAFRPEADKKKIHSRNEFELCYLRHQYLRRVDYNPSKEDMKPYLDIVSNLASKTYFTYRNLFRMIGFELEDVVSIGQIHLVSFLGLFSLEKLPEKYKDFVTVFEGKHERSPEAQDVSDKNRANLTMFLKQRMEDVVRVCRQKARNIKGLPTEEYYVYCSKNEPPKMLRDLIDNYEKLGFRKLDLAVYRAIRKRVRDVDGPAFKFNGYWYVCVHLEHKNLELVDFSGAGYDPYDNIHNMNPEEILFSKESNKRWSAEQEKFEAKTLERKVRMIKKFINTNKTNPLFKEELRVARRLLKEMDT